jgi:hypothetical protein
MSRPYFLIADSAIDFICAGPLSKYPPSVCILAGYMSASSPFIVERTVRDRQAGKKESAATAKNGVWTTYGFLPGSGPGGGAV